MSSPHRASFQAIPGHCWPGYDAFMAIPNIAIYGMGRFGRAFAAALVARKLPLVRVGGRSQAPEGWRRLYVRGPEAFLRGLKAELVVIAVPDDSLGAVASDFASQPDHIQFDYVHSSGVRGPDAIEDLADCEIGVFHILQSFPPSGGEVLIPGSYGAIDGDAGLLPILRELAAALDITVIELTDAQRVPYHAAAVLAANAMISLLDAGRAILEQAGIAPEHAGKMLIPLARGALQNAETLGFEQALTGPVVRSDVGTIERHLRVLDGATRRAYVSAMLAAADLAERSGRTDTKKLAEIRKLLEKA
jgi:predicted short-subunit dehydrogenase-like oxidoreductase (DUF2520 family)